MGARHCPLGLHALWGLRAAGVVAGCPRGGWPATVARGAWCQALCLPQPPALWSGQPGYRNPVSRVRSVRAWGPSTGPTACAPAGRRCSLWGRRKGVPGGGAFHHCQGRPGSGAVPPPTARPLGGPLGSATHVLWARVCGCGGPTLSPWPACPVGAVCRGVGGGPSLGGVACHRCEGRLEPGAVPPPAARPLERAARVPRPVSPGCGRCWCGDPAPVPQRAPLRAGVARCEGVGRASPGGVACHRCEGRLMSGAAPPPAARPLERAAGVLRPGVPGAVAAGVRTQHRPHSVRPCCGAVGLAEGRPRGGCLQPLWKASEVRRCPSPDCPPTGSGCWGPPATCCGRGCVGVGAQHCPLGLHAPWGLRAAGVVGGRPRGGVACHCCEWRLLSGAVPPPAARPPERAARAPRPLCPGCDRCGCGDPAPAPQRAPLRAGVARFGAGGRASRGGVPSTIVRGVWVQALSLPRPPACWAGRWGPPPTCCGRGCVGVGAGHCSLGLHAPWGLYAAGVVGGRSQGAGLPPL